MRRGANPRSRGRIHGRPDPIGQRIKDLRTARGMTLQDLAEKVGIAPSHVFHVENGDKVPGEDLAVEIARVLHEDEYLYRAWARARSRSDFYTAVESAGVLAQYIRGAEQPPGERVAQWERPRTDRASDATPPSAMKMTFLESVSAPQPARLLVPLIPAGADPGQASASSQVLRLDPRALDPAEPLE